MTVTAIIQARMSSSRLPGKVLKNLAGKPVLAHVVNRIGICQLVNQLIVATSTDSSDDVIEAWCKTNRVECFRGSLNDVLDRYYQCARKYHACNVLRITADCPAIDPGIVDETIERFNASDYDYYGLSGEFPNGLDCTLFRFSALEKAWREAKRPSEREHVGPYIENHKEIFKCGGYEKFHGMYNYRWTLDEEDDYRLLSKIFDSLYTDDKHPFNATMILNLLQQRPELMHINDHIIRNEGYLKSLKEDKEKGYSKF